MIRTLLSAAALACAALLYGAFPATAATAAPAATAVPSAPPAVMDRAKEWLGRMQRSDIDPSQLTPEMQTGLTDDVRKTLATTMGPFGAVKAMTLKQIMKKDGNTGYLFDVTFENGETAEYVFAVNDASGKVSGLRFTPTS